MIVLNMEKAINIGHILRREQRAEEFEPLDNLIARQIPGTDIQEIEAKRQSIRDKYASMQSQIDTAKTADEILKILGKK